MVSNINTPQPPDEARTDADALKEAASREAASAKAEAQKAGETIRDEASRLAAGAKDKAYETAESGKAYAAGNLNDFTAAIRKASDELGERDQSMAANLVREAASGLEQVSQAIEGKSIKELTGSVAGFARRQPAAFLIGAALAGVALGRFAKASSEHDERDYVGGDDRSRDDYGNNYAGGYGSSAERSRSYGAQDRGSTHFSREGGSSVTGSSGTGTSATGSTTAFPSSAAKSSVGASSGTSGSSTSSTGTPARETIGETATPGATSSPGTAQSATTPATSGFGAADRKENDHER